jgi:hypothetical protein
MLYNFDHFYFCFSYMSVNGWLYLIQRGDHRIQHEEIYKIGRTNDFK